MAIYEVNNNDYIEEIRRLEDSDPARAETIFNPLFSRIINNIAYVHRVMFDTDEYLSKMINDINANLNKVMFELAIKGYLDKEGMSHIVIDRIESEDDVKIIAGWFDEKDKKVYI